VFPCSKESETPSHRSFHHRSSRTKSPCETSKRCYLLRYRTTWLWRDLRMHNGIVGRILPSFPRSFSFTPPSSSLSCVCLLATSNPIYPVEYHPHLVSLSSLLIKVLHFNTLLPAQCIVHTHKVSWKPPFNLPSSPPLNLPSATLIFTQRDVGNYSRSSRLAILGQHWRHIPGRFC
jgi:hypothetical protein